MGVRRASRASAVLGSRGGSSVGRVMLFSLGGFVRELWVRI